MKAVGGVTAALALVTVVMTWPQVQQLTSDVVVLEFPFGAPAYERRYMFFAALHGRRLVNGDGALLPAGYVARRRLLTSPLLGGRLIARSEEASLYQIQTTERLARMMPPGSAAGVGPATEAASE